MNITFKYYLHLIFSNLDANANHNIEDNQNFELNNEDDVYNDGKDDEFIEIINEMLKYWYKFQDLSYEGLT